MFVNIFQDGSVSLEDECNFKEFYMVVASDADIMLSDARKLIVKSAADRHFWLDARRIIELSGRSGDEGWEADFMGMLLAVEKYGYFDAAKNLVKAHVK